MKIIRENRESDRMLKEAYIFPSDEEIRLSYLDPNTSPHRGDINIRPFYFGMDLQSGLDYHSAIALILPDEKAKLVPPDGWGTWDDAEVIKE